MGCYVRGDKKSMGCYVRGGKSLWDVLSGMSKNGMRCFVRGCFVWLPMIEVRSVSHAAWAHCRTGKSFEILIREGRRGSVSRITWESHIFQPEVNGNVPWIKKKDDNHVWVLAGLSVNIKYTVALFSALDVSVRKKMRLARFSLHFARNRMTPYVANLRPWKSLCINLFHSLSPNFRNSLSLSSGLIF